MKVLIDSCAWSPMRHDLMAAGHDVEWVGAWGGDPGDEAVLAAAIREHPCLITLDKGFGERVVRHRGAHSGLVRLVNVPSRQQAAVCLAVLARFEVELTAGAIVTAEVDRVRIRFSDLG